MPDASTQRALAYLRAHQVMSLATCGREGLWSAAVFYASEGFDLYFLSSATTRHAKNIEADQGVCATIQEDYQQWQDIKGIQLAGRAVLLQGAERSAAIDCYERKFSFMRAVPGMAQDLASALKSVGWYRLKPTCLYFVDNSLGFGHRDQIALTD